ncbi:MAG: hypothetical protein WC586_08725 [Methanoregula sp.]
MDIKNEKGNCARLGVDFGVSTTVIVAGDPGRDYPTVGLSGISRAVPGTTPGSVVHIIPSLIRYGQDGAVLTGCEALARDGEDLLPAARNLRSYLFESSPVQIMAGNGRMLRYTDAAGAFLVKVLSRALALYPDGADMVFALPADAPEDYPSWLDRAGRAAGARSCSWVHECIAAAEGCGISPAHGELFLFLSFSATEIAAMAFITEEHGGKTVARASAATGCQEVDGWITQDLLLRFRIHESEQRADRIRHELFSQAERARELIAQAGIAEIAVMDPAQGRTYTTRYSTDDLARVLADHGLIMTMQQVTDRLISALRAKGMETGQAREAFLTGPGWALPGLECCIREQLPGVPVNADHIIDGIARGAAQSVAQKKVPDRITGSYALRYWDPAAQEHHYRFLVHSGARFPSQGQVARITISAAYDGQTHLGIPLCGIGCGGENSCGIELISDRAGGIHIAGPDKDVRTKTRVVPLYEQSPTLLVADPPAKKGEPRFECTFTIDRERNLCISARDLVTGMLVKLNTPVYRLE